MKRIISILLLVAIILSVSACANSKPVSNTETTNTTTPTSATLSVNEIKPTKSKSIKLPADKDNDGEYDDLEVFEKLPGEVRISPDFNPNLKEYKYRFLPNFGYFEGLEIMNELSDMAIGYIGEEGKKYNKTDDSALYLDKYRIQSKYIYEEDEVGLMLDWEKIEPEYVLSYKKAVRRVGDFKISDFEHGVCINEYIFNEDEYEGKKEIIVNIPETLDGKPVIKLGSSNVKYDSTDAGDYEYYETGFLNSVPENIKVNVKLPSSVCDISGLAFDRIDGSYYNDNITVDERNPFYMSDKNALYTKDKKWLLHVNEYGKEFVVPKSVKYIASCAFSHLYGSSDVKLVLGKNIKHIYDLLSSKGKDKLRFKVYKGSYADKYLRGKYGENYNKPEVDESHIEYF